MTSDNVTAKQRVIIDSKIEILSKPGDDWHNVYELKNTYKLFRLEYSRFRIIFFFGYGNDLVITNAFIEKDKRIIKKLLI